MKKPSYKKTHFGFREILESEKTQKVYDVFSLVSGKYDLMNDLMSLGLHRLWKRFAIGLTGARAGDKVIDIAAGTGDMARLLASKVGPKGHVVLADINEAMLNVGRQCLIDEGIIENISFIRANAELLPFKDDYFDIVTIGFGLRNVTEKEKALKAMYRVLKPGGRLVVLEFSHLILDFLKPLYDLYSFKVLPFLGKLIVGDANSYRYLAESIRMHPDQITLKTLMENAGFDDCDYYNLTGGVVAVHRGYKF